MKAVLAIKTLTSNGSLYNSQISQAGIASLLLVLFPPWSLVSDSCGTGESQFCNPKSSTEFYGVYRTIAYFISCLILIESQFFGCIYASHGQIKSVCVW